MIMRDKRCKIADCIQHQAERYARAKRTKRLNDESFRAQKVFREEIHRGEYQNILLTRGNSPEHKACQIHYGEHKQHYRIGGAETEIAL